MKTAAFGAVGGESTRTNLAKVAAGSRPRQVATTTVASGGRRWAGQKQGISDGNRKGKPAATVVRLQRREKTD